MGFQILIRFIVIVGVVILGGSVWPPLCLASPSSDPDKKNLDPRFVVMDSMDILIWQNRRPLQYAQIRLALELEDPQSSSRVRARMPKLHDMFRQTLYTFLNRPSVNPQQPHLKLMKELLKIKFKSLFPQDGIKDILFEHYLIAPSFEGKQKDPSRGILNEPLTPSSSNKP